MKHKLLIVILLTTLAVACEEHEGRLIQRGVELRLAIAREFERLKSEQVPTNRPVTVDATVSKFIPPRTPFQDAIAILRAGHFTVGEPYSFSFAGPDGRQTEARLVHAEQTLAKYFGGATEVTILLDVDSVNPPPTVVKQAEGYIKTTYL
jgi:hypothetical protein